VFLNLTLPLFFSAIQYATLYEWRGGEQQHVDFTANLFIDVYAGRSRHCNIFSMARRRRRRYDQMMESVYSFAGCVHYFSQNSPHCADQCKVWDCCTNGPLSTSAPAKTTCLHRLRTSPPSSVDPLALPPSPVPKILGSPTPLASKNNDARMSRQPSTTSPNTPPVPLSNGQRTRSTFHFLPSRWTRHEHRLRLDLAPAVAPSTQHTRFIIFFLSLLTLVRSILVSIASALPYKYLAPGLAGRPSRQYKPSSPHFSFSLVCDLISFPLRLISPETTSLADAPRLCIPAGCRAINNRQSAFHLTRSIAHPCLET